MAQRATIAIATSTLYQPPVGPEPPPCPQPASAATFIPRQQAATAFTSWYGGPPAIQKPKFARSCPPSLILFIRRRRRAGASWLLHGGVPEPVTDDRVVMTTWLAWGAALGPDERDLRMGSRGGQTRCFGSHHRPRSRSRPVPGMLISSCSAVHGLRVFLSPPPRRMQRGNGPAPATNRPGRGPRARPRHRAG